MADDTNTTDSTATDDAATATTDSSTDDAQLPEGARNALKAARTAERAALKAQKAAEARVAEYENANKTETQKLAERAEAAEKAASDAAAKLLRYQVIEAKGVPAAAAKFLHGSTEDELNANADALIEAWGARTTDTPSFDGGVRTTATTGKSMNDLLRQAAGRT